MTQVASISQQIWDMKYRLKSPTGQPIDKTIPDSWRRVAKALAAVEKDSAHWEQAFLGAMDGFRFLPAGRILSGAGTDRRVTLFNCFVMGDIPDDMGGIFEQLKEAAVTMQQGGGIGYDFSTIRPKGAAVKGVGADASGPLSFMDVWDAMCRTIMSAGSRRGAMMAVMRCDHPDIEAFIDAKREAGRLRMFNLSVLVTDAFMQAVRDDAAWPLVFDGTVYKSLPARELWDTIMRATYAYAEPGVIFIDRVNRLNNLSYCETIHATNPCVTGDTPVLTRSGPRAIASLTEPCEILGSDGEWHLIKPAFRTGTKPVFRLATDGGRELRLTADHRVLAEDPARPGAFLDIPAEQLITGASRVRVADLRDGHALFSTETVVAIEACGEESVWDLTEPETHHFVANGFVVHNCGEQPLPPYGVCLLGSVNLAALVEAPFTDAARLDENALADLVRTAVRMMDNVIDVSNFPLPQHAHEARSKRRIGLGITGLADALLMCRSRYGSPQAVTLTERWLARIRREAYLASTELAAEKGSFPLFDAEKYLAGEYIQSLDADVREAIARNGIRNALLTSIAPTGTISLFADNVSSGLEPVFSFKYTRTVLMPDGSRREEEVSDHAYRAFRRQFGEAAPLPDYFVDAQSLEPRDHLVMQAAVQKYVDSSISKTINVPESISFDDFKDVYLKAYEMGCKGCTTYRPNEVTGAVLEVRKEAQAELPLEDCTPAEAQALRADNEASVVHHLTQPLTRPEALGGRTYKVRWPESEHAIYITVNDVVQDGRVRPFEVFINSKNLDHYAWTVALTRMISAVFRRGGDVAFVVEELKAVFDPRGGHWMGGRYVPSLLAAIGEVIERHMIDIGFLADPLSGRMPSEERKVVNIGHSMFRHCPKCGQPSLARLEGCDTCTSCGYSKCG